MNIALALLLLSCSASAAPARSRSAQAPRSQQQISGTPAGEGEETDETPKPAESPEEAPADATTQTGEADVPAGAPSGPATPPSKAAGGAQIKPKSAPDHESANTLGGSLGSGGAAAPKIKTRCGTPLTTLPKKTASGDAFDLGRAAVVKGVNIADWKITSRLDSVSFGKDEVCTPHSKAGQWPKLPFFGDANTPVEGNMWMYAYLDGRWVGGAGHWLRPGQTCKGGNLWEVGPDVYYDSDPLKHWSPCPGELVGFVVSTPARGGQWGGAERSNAILVRWPAPAAH